MNNKLMQGVWGEKLDTVWEFFIADSLPEDVEVSAVMGIPFWEGKLALVHTKRGWEIPGGHVEEGEDAERCLERELKEEIGASEFISKKLFGYRKITNPDRKVSGNDGKKYPRNTIVPYYLVELGAPPSGANADDSYASGLFGMNDAIVHHSHDRDVLLIGVSIKSFYFDKCN